MPDLVLEPGRALVSDAQVLLLTVGAARERPGAGRFAIADGGAMTVSMMFMSEYHALLLANREAPLGGRTSLFGRLASPMDVVYRNCPLRRLARVLDRAAGWTARPWWGGGAVLVAGLALAAWAMTELWRGGGGLPVSALPPPRFTRRGPYALVRHPIYLGFTMWRFRFAAGSAFRFQGAVDRWRGAEFSRRRSRAPAA